MSDFVLFTDSCCDLPDEMAREWGLEVLPLCVQLGDESFANYLDGRELSINQLYSRMRNGQMPTTSAVSVGSFEDAMRIHLEAGRDILYVGFASALSTTYQSAMIAAEELRPIFPQRTIEVVDSHCATLGQGLLMILCAQQQQNGATLAQVKAFAQEQQSKIHHWFAVDDLNHLRRGGRISNMSAVVGSMLSIKPILWVTAKGKLEAVGKERGRKASLNALVQKVETLEEPMQKQMIFIAHGDCIEDAQYVERQLIEKLGISADRIRIHFFGAVVGCHTGPGTMGIFFVGGNAR